MNAIARLLITIVLANFLSFTPGAYALDSDEQKEPDPAMATKKRKHAFGEAAQQSREKRQECESFPELPDWCTCGICNNEYDKTGHPPWGLLCQHTFCAPCLKSHSKELSARRRRMNCPNCRQIVPMPNAINGDLLEAVLDYKRQFQPIRWSSEESKNSVRLVCELHCKKGQQRRCDSNQPRGLVEFDWAIELFGLIEAAGPLSGKDAKVGGWIFSQTAFLLSDLENSDAGVFFEKASKYFEIQLESAKAARDDEACKLIFFDTQIVKLHHLKHKLLFGKIDFNEAKMELDTMEASLAGNTPRRLAQLKIVQAVYFLMIGDFENAFAYAKDSMDLTINEPGAEICTWTLIRILADEMEQRGLSPSLELLERYQADKWKIAFERVRKRACARGGYIPAGPWYDLGRVAINFGLLKEAQDLMSRAHDTATQLKAELDKYAAEKKFEGLPNGFCFALPKWHQLAKVAADGLACDPAEVQAAAEGNDEPAALDNSASMQDQTENLKGLMRTWIQQIKARVAQAEQAAPLADAVFPEDLGGLADRNKAKIRQFFEGI